MLDFSKTKTDQYGIKNIDHPWCMYANTLEPVVCPLLALARYIISHPSILTGQGNLFEWNYQYECSHKIFNEIVQTHQYEFEFLGRTVEYLGTHYIRLVMDKNG